MDDGTDEAEKPDEEIQLAVLQLGTKDRFPQKAKPNLSRNSSGVYIWRCVTLWQ
jgi:hypothetical protein